MKARRVDGLDLFSFFLWLMWTVNQLSAYPFSLESLLCSLGKGLKTPSFSLLPNGLYR